VVDAFLLKILVEQELGYPTELVPDGEIPEIPSNLTGPESVYEALESGAVHMYPEVADFFRASSVAFQVAFFLSESEFAGLAFRGGRNVCRIRA
jgi:hypothetical protein